MLSQMICQMFFSSECFLTEFTTMWGFTCNKRKNNKNNLFKLVTFELTPKTDFY